MPSYEQWKKRRDIEVIRETEAGPQILRIVRPIIVHEVQPNVGKLVSGFAYVGQKTGDICDCGYCGSRRTRVKRIEPYLDVMFDRDNGQRSVRNALSPDKQAYYDELAADDTGIVSVHERPWLCSEMQYPGIRDWETTLLMAFGGNQSGKTVFGANKMVDYWLVRGGRGREFLWVSSTMRNTRIGVKKLVEGEPDAPMGGLIPREFVEYFPKNEHQAEQAIILIDGSKIWIRYGSSDGGNLKGIRSYGTVIDEGTEIDHEINLTIIAGRKVMTGGQIVIPTTPKVPHWLAKFNDTAVTYEQLEADPELPRGRVRMHMTCFDNPWADPDVVKANVEALGGPEDPRVRREFYGEWIAGSGLAWPHFDTDVHVVSWAGNRDDFSGTGYRDITPKVAHKAFRARSKTADEFKVPFVVFMDFNYSTRCPPTALVGRVLVREGDDETDPHNWVLYVEDEITKRFNDAHSWAEYLSDKAGADDRRGLAPDYFRGCHAVVDATGFQKGGGGKDKSYSARVMQNYGMVVRAPTYKKVANKSKPVNPERYERRDFLNDLLSAERPRLIINGRRCPETINALSTETLESYEDKKSGSKEDRVSGFTDSLGYGAYGLLWRESQNSGATLHR